MVTIIWLALKIDTKSVEQHTEPVIDPEIRHQIPDSQVRPAVIPSDQKQEAACNEQTKIAQKYQLAILGLVQWARRTEMIDTSAEPVFLPFAAAFDLALVLIVAGDISEQVKGPTKQLLSDQVSRCGDRSLLHQLIQLMEVKTHSRGVLVTSLRHKDHVTLKVSGCFVVFAVRYLPGEIGDK